MTDEITIPEELLNPSSDMSKAISEKLLGLLATNTPVISNVSVAEAKGLKDEVSSISKTFVDIQGQFSSVSATASTAALDAKAALAATEAVSQFSARILQLEFKVARLLAAVAAAGVDVDLAPQSAGT